MIDYQRVAARPTRKRGSGDALNSLQRAKDPLELISSMRVSAQTLGPCCDGNIRCCLPHARQRVGSRPSMCSTVRSGSLMPGLKTIPVLLAEVRGTRASARSVTGSRAAFRRRLRSLLEILSSLACLERRNKQLQLALDAVAGVHPCLSMSLPDLEGNVRIVAYDVNGQDPWTGEGTGCAHSAIKCLSAGSLLQQSSSVLTCGRHAPGVYARAYVHTGGNVCRQEWGWECCTRTVCACNRP
jgi:hypothetical protein